MIISLLVLQATSTLCTKTDEFTLLPSHRYSSGVIAVSAECPPGSRHWFLLDTGSPDTVVASTSAKGSGDDVDLVLKVGGTPIKVEALVEPEVSKMGFPTDGPKIEGILGTDLLRKVQIVFDGQAGKLYARPAVAGAFEEGMARALKAVGGTANRPKISTLRLSHTEDGYFYASVQYEGSSAVAVVDTGGSAMFVPKDTLPAIGGKVRARSESGAKIVGLAVGRIASPGMGARVFACGIRDDDTPPTVSVPALSGRWWYFDFANDRFAFEAPPVDQDAERLLASLIGRNARLKSEGLEVEIRSEGARRWQPIVSIGGAPATSWVAALRQAATKESALESLRAMSRSLMKLKSFETIDGSNLRTFRIDKE